MPNRVGSLSRARSRARRRGRHRGFAGGVARATYGLGIERSPRARSGGADVKHKGVAGPSVGPAVKPTRFWQRAEATTGRANRCGGLLPRVFAPSIALLARTRGLEGRIGLAERALARLGGLTLRQACESTLACITRGSETVRVTNLGLSSRWTCQQSGCSCQQTCSDNASRCSFEPHHSSPWSENGKQRPAVHSQPATRKWH
jgi:hypothetical protein